VTNGVESRTLSGETDEKRSEKIAQFESTLIGTVTRSERASAPEKLLDVLDRVRDTFSVKFSGLTSSRDIRKIHEEKLRQQAAQVLSKAVSSLGQPARGPQTADAPQKLPRVQTREPSSSTAQSYRTMVGVSFSGEDSQREQSESQRRDDHPELAHPKNSSGNKLIDLLRVMRGPA
jgi:hypothetical protein